ncbi:holin [Clostridium sp. CX1]|uniref:Holin n=1 Tax=Clostridium tanneri TaxID=3037988 RepID=A0ABU4JR16_9CLOT|nr:MULTISPECIES: holin [unclassified Clostridium]MCT8977631.1 holin [Clostridium sp. CX1]MDW8800406.1 holin [Clostridium sp. A1-XYC3]
MNRFRNYGLWLSIAAFIPMLLKAFGKDILPDNYDELINAFLSILVIAGILNNPQTNNRGFLDDASNRKKLK